MEVLSACRSRREDELSSWSGVPQACGDEMGRARSSCADSSRRRKMAGSTGFKVNYVYIQVYLMQ